MQLTPSDRAATEAVDRLRCGARLRSYMSNLFIASTLCVVFVLALPYVFAISKSWSGR